MLTSFLLNYGYYGLFLGSAIEGETIVMGIASLAYSGTFNIFNVIIVAFLGTFLADQICFYVGRFFGKKIFKKYKNLEEKSKKIFLYIEKYDTPFILGFRFVYGIRILSPFVIGASKVPNIKFSILNFVAAVIWSITICGIGYFIGMFGNSLIGPVNKGYSFLLIWGINTLLTLSIISFAHYLSKKINLN